MDLTGEELSALAYAEPPIQPEGLARILMVVAITFLCLTTLVVGLRTWVRSWALRHGRLWGIDDSLAVLGYIPFVFCCSFAIYSAHYGVGSPDSKLNPFLMIRAAEYVFYWQLNYAISAPLVKASIGVAVMRLTQERRYRYLLWAVMLIPAATTFAGTIMLVSLCHPVAAQWNPALGTCGSRDIISIVSYSFTVVAIITDLCCAIIPYFIIRNLQMPRRSKISLVMILGLGVFASVGAIVRAPYLSAYAADGDQLYQYANILIWSFVENGIGIIAGSLPPLRKLFGVYFETRNHSDPDFARAGAPATIGGTPLSLVRPSSSRNRDWNKLDDGTSSMYGIVQETEFRIERRSMADGECLCRHETEIRAIG